jgi:hypothetical protein
MNAPLNILAALASYGVKAVIENGRVRLVCSKDDPPPAELIDAARARKEELRALLTDDEQAPQDFVEVRAAFPEFDAGAKAEAIAGAELTGNTQGSSEDDGDLHESDGVPLRFGTYSQALAALRAECPAYVDAAHWRQAIEDVTASSPRGVSRLKLSVGQRPTCSARTHRPRRRRPTTGD